MMPVSIFVSALTVLAPMAASGPESARDAAAPGVRWDARAAEHLLNRAGFGGTDADVERLVRLGHERAVDSLFAPASPVPAPRILSERTLHGDLEDPAGRHASLVARRAGFTAHQPDLIVPLNKYGDWWVERMYRSEDPLRDHLTIFWHGHFVSSVKEVGSSQEMIDQIQFLRDNALGRFAVLCRGIGKTPAMLEYLDNDENVKAHPNENWARELIELFSLGDGNYTEKDIKESARAFTGWSDAGGAFKYNRLDHDFGQKTYLGVTGNLDGDQCVDVVLQQPACGRFIAAKLLDYFEGQPAAEERVEEYARFLRTHDYDVAATLRKLFLDPAFYRDEVVGTRVQGPVEYLVGACRKLGLEVPGQMLQNGADMLGQRLFWPPSVKGWEGGMSWINTATLMNRSNVVGAMLGLVDMRSLIVDEEFDEDAMSKRDRQSRTNGLNQIRVIQEHGWEPELDLAGRARAAGARSDAALAQWMMGELISIPVEPAMVAAPAAWLGREREALGIASGALLESAEAEPLLRRFAHLILSLPEAQLH